MHVRHLWFVFLVLICIDVSRANVLQRLSNEYHTTLGHLLHHKEVYQSCLKGKPSILQKEFYEREFIHRSWTKHTAMENTLYLLERGCPSPLRVKKIDHDGQLMVEQRIATSSLSRKEVYYQFPNASLHPSWQDETFEMRSDMWETLAVMCTLDARKYINSHYWRPMWNTDRDVFLVDDDRDFWMTGDGVDCLHFAALFHLKSLEKSFALHYQTPSKEFLQFFGTEFETMKTYVHTDSLNLRRNFLTKVSLQLLHHQPWVMDIYYHPLHNAVFISEGFLMYARDMERLNRFEGAVLPIISHELYHSVDQCNATKHRDQTDREDTADAEGLAAVLRRFPNQHSKIINNYSTIWRDRALEHHDIHSQHSSDEDRLKKAIKWNQYNGNLL